MKFNKNSKEKSRINRDLKYLIDLIQELILSATTIADNGYVMIRYEAIESADKDLYKLYKLYNSL